MKLVWKLAIPQIVIVVCLGLAGYYTINSSFISMREQYVRDVVEHRFQLITSGIASSSQRAVSETSLFVNLPVVRQAYETAFMGDIDDPSSPYSQAAREMLREALAPMLDSHFRITGSYLQLHFHLPNGLSLVRLWRERQTRVDGEWIDISDDLRSYRPTVLDVNRTGEIAMGIESGSGGFAIRGVIPVMTPDGRQIGSAEVLQDFNPVLDAVTDEGAISISLYANNDILEFSVELQDLQRYPHKGDFVRIVESRDSLAESLISAELLARGKYGVFFEDHGFLTLATFPLTDYRGSQVGVIVCAMNTTAISAVSHRAAVILAIMLVGMAITPTIALLFLLRALVTRPLNRIKAIIKDIAEDRADLSDKVPSRQADEIGDLARWFNTLTAKLDGILKERQEMIRKEAALNAQLAQERDVIRTMEDNIDQGIFLMDRDLKILPQYSKPLISIFSWYESDLAGKSFLDILSASLDNRQLKTMKSYFSMVFDKSKSMKVLESANPISEFEYKTNEKTKILSSRFHLIEQADTERLVIGIIQDITREKEFDAELKTQKEAQELEMKNMFDVIQIDPMVFHDFIDDTEANFNYINAILKDRSLTEKQVVQKFFQNVHAIKSNALVLGLENFSGRLHALEDDIKKVSGLEEITVDDILSLAVKLEVIMEEKDSYLKMVNRIAAFRTSNQLDTVLLHSLNSAVEKISAETKKKAVLKISRLDRTILESKLRKPIKDIIFQCLRNSIYHGIESAEERVRKNKKPQGLLTVSLQKSGGMAELCVSDDGRGLNWEKIKAKYLELHPGSAEPDKKNLLPLIFTPEFSTSEEVNLTAGRGVGLSYVKDLVRDNNGTISVSSSESGLGFRFVFPMPA